MNASRLTGQSGLHFATRCVRQCTLPEARIVHQAWLPNTVTALLIPVPSSIYLGLNCRLLSPLGPKNPQICENSAKSLPA